MIDWSGCPDVERIPGKVSGAWLVVGTRIPAAAVVDNAEAGYSPEDIVAKIYPSLPLQREAHPRVRARDGRLGASSLMKGGDPRSARSGLGLRLDRGAATRKVRDLAVRPPRRRYCLPL